MTATTAVTIGKRRRRRRQQQQMLAGACCFLVGLGKAAGALRGGGESGPRQLSQYILPKVNGYPIDYCLHYVETHYGPDNALVSRRGEGCGKPAADKFCQLEGYPEAEFSTAIYYSHNATWVLGDDELNPREETMSKGEHTYFDRVSCRIE